MNKELKKLWPHMSSEDRAFRQRRKATKGIRVPGMSQEQDAREGG
jgi:hypothetical protein